MGEAMARIGSLEADNARLRDSLIRTDNENCRVSKLRFEAVRRGQQKDREIERLKSDAGKAFYKLGNGDWTTLAPSERGKRGNRQ
jgi:hypothetical protein